jgi:hypothetical protein
MSDAAETIWAFHDGPMVGYFVGKDPGRGSNVAKYRRDDLPATDEQALANEKVKALVEALEVIAGEGCERSSWFQSKARAALVALENPDE